MAITRREWLRLSAGLAPGLWLGGLWPLGLPLGCSLPRSPGAGDLILGGGRYRNLDSGRVEHVFSVVDLDRRAVDLLPLDFLAHGIHLHPDRPETLAVFEKKGPHAVEIDLATREVTRPIETDSSRWFYGHGAYSLDGEILYCTETVLDGLAGRVAIRDASTHAVLGEFPSHGREPHECKLIDEGRTMVVTNGGGPLGGEAPSLAYIDVASQKLLERVELSNARLNTGHAAVGADGALVVVSAPRSGLDATEPGGVSIRPRGGRMRSLSDPTEVTARMQGEALSVAIFERAGIAAVTHPDGDMVTFWSTRDRRLLRVLDLPRPRGVTLTRDERAFVISFGAEASLLRVAVDGLEPLDDSLVPDTYISGSHIYNWSRGLTREILAPPAMTATADPTSRDQDS